MSVILSPDGRSLADRTTQPMTAAQVKWFLDADAFLQHVPHLWTLSLKLFCLRCWKKGLNDSVKVTFDESHQTYRAACECAKVAGRLPRAEIQTFATDELLTRLGWSLACTNRCAKDAGLSDGVEANNDQTSQTLSIRCGCTVRQYVLSHAPSMVVQ